MGSIIKGKAWVGGDNIDVYKIIPRRRWIDNSIKPEDFGLWALEDADEAFKEKPWALKDSGAEIIIAGKNFGGGGKSIESPIYALQGAGIKIVIADSFARFNFRNSVNNGLPVLTCQGMNKLVSTGDEVIVNLAEGYIEKVATGERVKFMPFSPFVMEILNSGGLIPYAKEKIKRKI